MLIYGLVQKHPESSESTMTLNLIYKIAAVIFLFGITIFAHELGHFLVARWFGMVVDVFSIGFGPAIWKKKIKGVLYKICVIPIGGYVALPQMDPNGAGSESQTSSHSKDIQSSGSPRKYLQPVAPWKKIIVAVAGALGNIALAMLIAWVVFLVGKPSTPAERCSVIGFVETNSIAYQKGIRTGDEIIAVNAHDVNSWNEMLQECARFREVYFTLKTPEGLRSVCVPTEKSILEFRMVRGLRAVTICRVIAVELDSSAARAGIRYGDVIKTFNNIKVLSIEHLITLVSSQSNRQVDIGVVRNDELLKLQVTPRLDPALGRARIGIRFDPMAVDYDQVVHIRPGVQLRNHATMIFRVVRSLVTPKEARATAQGLGGPIMIVYMLLDVVSRGVIIALSFTCFLNVNLAILNLLPIPVLDGGHIMFSLWELITRKPLHQSVVVWLSHICAGLLICAILLLSGRDVKRLLKLRRLMKSNPAQERTTNAVPSSAGGMDK